MASIADAIARLREIALRYPETLEDHPWGHDVFKVRGRMFLMLSEHEGSHYVTLKLPASFEFALEYRGPTGVATFFIHQKITAFVNQYWIHDGRSGAAGALLAFAHQKRLALRERFLFFTDESKAHEAFHIQARQVLDFGASYDVVDSDGRALGVFRKAFGASLLRSTWEVLDPASGNPIVVARERSVPVAVFRRLWGWIPYLGDAPFFIKYHFDLIDAQSGAPVGEYFKVTRLRDHYRLTVDDRYLEAVDWRTFVSLGVAMDALQGR